MGRTRGLRGAPCDPGQRHLALDGLRQGSGTGPSVGCSVPRRSQPSSGWQPPRWRSPGGRATLTRLAPYGIKTREGLHSDEGRAVAFLLLVDAFRERRYDRAALWIASLSHSTGDMAAANHDPLVHVYTYAYGAEYNLRLPCGVPVKMMAPLLDLHLTTPD